MPSITNCAAFVKKHVVLLISQKDYVTFFKLLRWIMDYWAVRKFDKDKICPGSAEERQTHIWLDRQEGECLGSEV